jgi:hypothetical protein
MDRPSDPEATAQELLSPPEEAQLGTSAAGRSVSAAIVALARTARSFLLYDPRNDAIRRFIEDLREKMTAALATVGSIVLEVRPFELALGDEVVYLERDRERSLAFRMFRDGVRRLTVREGATWDELLRLLEVLSVRYAGVRQNEDDIVTLLCKAAFQHIEVDAVEGFVPEDEDDPASEGAGRRGLATTGLHVDAPADRDLPLRPMAPPLELAWRAVAEADLEALRAEEASQALPASAARAVVEMLAVVADPTDPTTLADVAPFIGEVRDFLLAEGQLGPLKTIVTALAASAEAQPDDFAPLLATFGDKRAISRILHSVPTTVLEPPEELVGLLEMLPADHLTHLIDILGEERDEASRRLARQLIERYAPHRPDDVLARLRVAEPAVACDLLQALARALPERAVEAADALARHSNDQVVFEAIRVLETAPAGPKVTRRLASLIESSSSEVRLRAVAALVRRGEFLVFGPIARFVEEHAATTLTTEEADALGEAMAQVAPEEALTLFTAWLRPKGGFLTRLMEAPRRHLLLQWTAVAGLAVLPGEEPETLLRETASRASEDLRRRCRAALAQRRRTGAERG